MNWIRRHKPTGTVVCQASNPKNLHSEYGKQLGLSSDYEDLQAEFNASCGDKLVGDSVVACPGQRPVEPPISKSDLELKVEALEAKVAALEARR